MARTATKAAENVWYRARFEASKVNERLSSREGLSDITGIDRTRIARIELGTLNPYPEEARLIAMTCNAPELQNYYCRECCALGKNMPKVDKLSLDRITIKAMSSMSKISAAKKLLLEITEDGIISDEERPDLEKIIELLDELTSINENLKAWLERNR